MRGVRMVGELALAIGALCILLSLFFFSVLVPIAAILLYGLLHYAFVRRARSRRSRPLRDLLLESEAEARAADIRRAAE